MSSRVCVFPLAALTLVSTLVSAHAGTVPVIDVTNIVQSTITAVNSVTQVANQAAAYARQAQQLYAQYQSISYQVQNLQHLDSGSLLAIVQLSQAVTSNLQGVRGMSYQVDTALRQFDALYPKLAEGAATAGSVLSAAQAAALQGQMRRARFDTAQAVVQLSAVSGALDQVNAQTSRLLTRAAASAGAHDLGQVQAAQTGVTQGLLMRVEQQLAVSNRLAAQQAAESAQLEEARARYWAAKAAVPPPDPAGRPWRFLDWR